MNIHIAYDIVKKYFKSDPSIYRKFMTSYRKYSKSPSDNVEAMNSAEEVLFSAFKSGSNGKIAEREYNELISTNRKREINFERGGDSSRTTTSWESMDSCGLNKKFIGEDKLENDKSGRMSKEEFTSLKKRKCHYLWFKTAKEALMAHVTHEDVDPEDKNRVVPYDQWSENDAWEFLDHLLGIYKGGNGYFVIDPDDVDNPEVERDGIDESLNKKEECITLEKLCEGIPLQPSVYEKYNSLLKKQ